MLSSLKLFAVVSVMAFLLWLMRNAYTTSDAMYVGRALGELDAYWFEEPITPEDLNGYRALRKKLDLNISGGEAEFNRWGWCEILENCGLDIAQPEVCALGGITEYLRAFALCHEYFTPVVNHAWGPPWPLPQFTVSYGDASPT